MAQAGAKAQIMIASASQVRVPRVDFGSAS